MHLSTSFLVSLSAAVATVNGALTRVSNFGNNPTGLEMNINLPSKLAQKPGIILAVSQRNFFTFSGH
jgi:acetylxylan esterase